LTVFAIGKPLHRYNMSVELAKHPHRALLVPGIIHNVVTIMKDEEDYGTLAAFALASRFHHSVLQGVLAKVKKEIVLCMEDFRWRDQGNDENIKCVDFALSLASASFRH
jgi:hypothetical protein